MRINFETFSKVENIEIKSYLKSYINNIVEDNTKILTNFGNKELIQSINIYDFGTLLDNLLANAQQREAKQINIYFDEDNTKMHFVSDTGPIDIEPVDDIFKLELHQDVEEQGWDCISVVKFVKILVGKFQLLK